MNQKTTNQGSDIKEKSTSRGSSASTGAPDTDQKGATAELRQGLTRGIHEISEQVTHLAHDVSGEAKETAEAALSAKKEVAVKGVRSVARALRKTSDELRAEDNGALPGYVSQAADRVESASRYLESKTLAQVLDDVEGFARREPALFLGGAFALGLIGGRFLKSSTPASQPGARRQSGRMGYGQMGYGAERGYGERQWGSGQNYGRSPNAQQVQSSSQGQMSTGGRSDSTMSLGNGRTAPTASQGESQGERATAASGSPTGPGGDRDARSDAAQNPLTASNPSPYQPPKAPTTSSDDRSRSQSANEDKSRSQNGEKKSTGFPSTEAGRGGVR
jgi:hypothetical protein